MRNVAAKMAEWLIRNGGDPAEMPVLLYGCECLLIASITYGAILLIGGLLGNVIGAACWIAALLPVRTTAGGIHAPTRIICFLVSTGSAAASVCSAQILANLILAGWVLIIGLPFCVYVVFRTPVVHLNHPLSKRQIETNRNRSRIAVMAESAAIAALYLYPAARSASLCGFFGLLCAVMSQLLGYRKARAAGSD